MATKTNGTANFKPDSSAKSIYASQVLGINRLVKLLIVIEGKVISHYKHFSLSQHSAKHHRFEMVLAYDSLGNRENHNLESSNEFLGKRITVVQKYKDIPDSPERTFVGVITEVSYTQDQSGLGNIVLSGYSPTILLDAAPHTHSFGGTQSVNMSIIANQLIKEGLKFGFYDLRVDANDYSEIIYSAQYNETHYNYLARMAEAYGEQFYYDGEVLHFGKLPPMNDPLKLYYGSNVDNIKIEIKAVHTKPQFYGYNSSQNAKLTSGTTPANHKSDLANRAYKTNETGIFKTPSLQIAPIRAVTDKDVVNSQTSASGSKAVEVLHVSGSTSIPFLYPGCVVDLEMRKEDSNQTSYFTRLMIVETSHDVDTLGHYTGTFKAIASDTGFLPTPEFTLPIAQPQLATVISNSDPSGQGRVTVKFDWQLHDTTDFIRMMSPDAGGTDQVSQNRGYVAIPEVGDQVMVGFVHNHPDRPFVMGGMFHGGTGLGGGAQNHMRSIQTKSGIKVLMNDNEKSVTILDPSGNTYFMDGNGNIEVTAPKNMTFNAGENLTITAGKEITVDAGNSITSSANENITSIAGTDIIQTAAGDIKESSDTRTEMVEKEFRRQSETSNEIAGEISMFSEKENMTMQSGKIVEFNSAEKSKLF